jgi:23S rRNA (adenine2030-N6)-methyltransferase
MLSYRHAFHAGNHADILKHSILARIIMYLEQKDKPFSYIDTHAGAGIYNLDAEWAQKTGEAERGILTLLNHDDAPDFFSPYMTLCRTYYGDGHRYPGSPEIVRALAREDDRIWLTELHPAEIENLQARMPPDSRVHIQNRDGYAALTALCPPDPRRGLMLMDPSYETVDDYEKPAGSFIALHKRWPAGILALWYPIVARRADELRAMKEGFARSGIPGILVAELFTEAKDEPDAEWGLSGSGMLIVQPPWKLASELETALPWLAGTMGGRWNVEWLVPDA